MKHKHFFGTSVPEAMQRARHKLGADVFLIETKPLTISGSNSSGLIQITVGVPDVKQRDSKKNNSRLSGQTEPGDFSEYLDRFSKDLYTPSINRKRAVDRRSAKTNRHKTSDKVLKTDDLMTLLLSSGISSEHAAMIQEELDNNSQPGGSVIDNLKKSLCEMFDPNVARNFLRTESQRVIALVGPTGVGKSSVIMKMAANKHIFRGKKTAIISTDTYRIAGSESLRAFSELVGIKFLELKHSDELSKQIDALQEYEIILVDTPGRSPLFPNYFNELQDCFANDDRIEKLVVLSAASDLEDIFLSSALFTLLDPVGLIVTKLDETSRAGKLVSIQNGTGLPILFVSDGQSIPIDLVAVSGDYIWEKISSLL